MNHNVPSSSAEKTIELPSALKGALEKDNLEASPNDLSEYQGLLSEDVSSEDIAKAHQDFFDKFKQAVAEEKTSNISEARRGELIDLMLKLRHKIAVGEAALDVKRGEPKGTRYEDRTLKPQLKAAEQNLQTSGNLEETNKTTDQIKDLRARRELNRKKVEAKMSTMEPEDQEILARLDQENNVLEAEYKDLEQRKISGKVTGSEYTAAKNKLDDDSRSIFQQTEALEQKYNL